MNPVMRRSAATFFVSSGRAGTQWLAATLGRHYADRAEVRHEPIDHGYCPRVLMRSDAGLDGHPEAGRVAAHLAAVGEVLADRDYIETGWPAFAAVPLLRETFGQRLKVVHLTRHPVYSACSMVTHRYYQPDRRDDGYTRYAILHPDDPGTLHRGYADRWDRLSPYEKCLFHWTEIHAYGLELADSYAGRIDWLRLRMEDLFDPDSDALDGLLDFLNLPLRPGVVESARTRFDIHHTRTDLPITWKQVLDHPEVVGLAATLGYDATTASTDEITGRYQRVVEAGAQ